MMEFLGMSPLEIPGWMSGDRWNVDLLTRVGVYKDGPTILTNQKF